MNIRTMVTQAAVAVALIAISAQAEAQKPNPETDPESPIMLAGDWVPEDPHQIDYEKLPRVTAKHAIISDVRGHAGTRVHQHAYLAHHDGRFWAMWSDGPGGPRAGATPEQHRNIVPAHDMPGTRNSFATSKDGLHWSKPADLTGPPRKKGYGWIARGLWKRDGELLALASHFDAPGYEGLGLSLEAFRWNGTKWAAHGTVFDDSMNNFPPKRLPSGEWMMTRRDHQRQVSVMIGGTKAFNDWRINPLAAYNGNGRPEEPYWYILPDGKTIVGLIRDNGRSKFLLRTFSRDNGKTWSELHRTNFPDATSKFFVHRTSRGYYVMVSNSNPRRRDPLTLAISQDGLVFTKLFRLIGGRHVDYPHIIEHDGHLLVAFSGAKQTMEVMKVSLDELERLAMPESVELAQHLPPVKQPPQQPRPHWIDLGDEGKTLYVAADLVVPEVGKRATFSLSTARGAERVVIGIDEKGRLTAQLYKETVTGLKLEPGSRHSLLIRLHSHREKPDEQFVQLGSPGKIPNEPKNWTISNTKGRSAANLSRVVLHSDADDFGGFKNVRIAPTREGLATAKVVAEGADDTAAEPDFEAVLARFRSGTVTLPDGRKMNWHRRTGTGPSLVLIPGTWGDLQSFAPLLAELPGDMPVIVVELCWQGGLVPKRTDLSIKELADDVLHVVTKLNTGDFFISGRSIGGMITVEIAGRNVRGLRGAIPIEGWTHHSVVQKAFAGVTTAGLSPEQQVRRNRDRARGRRHLNTGQLSAISSIWRRWNGASSLDRSQVPILHIWGDRGRPRPDRSALQIPDRPQIEIAWFRDASHAVGTLQARKEVAAAIGAFMKRHTRRAPATTAPLGSIDRVDAPPNIVLIVIDDLGYGDLGCYGSKVHKTPNIDALADAGLRLTDFHTNGPVCSPTRAALMTGQYQQRSGIESAIGFVTDEGVPLEKVTIAELLRKRGYKSGIVGKWHLGWVGTYGPNDQGFDISYCSNNSPDYHSHVSRNGKVDWYKDHKLHKENGYLTDLVTRHSNAFIEQNKEEPFFLFVSHLALHFPFQGQSDPPFRTEGKLWHGNERIPGKVQPDSKYGPLPPEKYQRAYRDMLEAVDASVGSIVATLDRLDLRRNTLIVITSDNGAYSWVGSNGIYRGQKGDLFEGGHRVPAVFNWPGRISKGVVNDSTTMTMDLAPTFTALAGLEESDSRRFDGIDLSELLFGKAPVPVRTLFWRFNNSYTSTHARSVREGKWKYVLEKDVPYLFDLDKDPAEEQNLASDYPDRVRDMDDAFLAWEKKVAHAGDAQ